MLQVELVGDEVLRQPVKQWSIAGRVRGAEVIHRVDNAAAKEVAPYTIDDGPGEEGIVGTHHPVHQNRAWILSFRNVHGRSGRRTWSKGFRSDRMWNARCAGSEPPEFRLPANR